MDAPMNTRPAITAAALALLLAAAPASAAPQEDAPQNGNAADAAPALPATAPVRDRYERYNRFMFKVNDKADRYVFAPVARGYRKAAPKPVRTGVRNFFNNLRDVVSFGSNLLRLDIKRASEDFMRVSVNTTFGLAGLIDVAGAGGIPDNKNSLGDTFASWGWKNSHYFVYPVLGPSTLRDSVGTTALMAYPVQNTIFHTTAGRAAASGLNPVSTREGYLDLTDSLDDAALDPYIMVRDAYMQMRDKQIGNRPSENGGGEDIDIDELVAPESSGAQTAPQAAPPAATPDTAEAPADNADAPATPETPPQDTTETPEATQPQAH
ncbi:MlaA family lipoprotein [Neisseria bacilliformis]|uniref:MlaA family lipoprotein n=1 Tax=Neisseria bacilliformis TaxID=267212 RepID=UPI0036F280EB